MFAFFRGVSLLALASASVLSLSTARAQDQPADPPATPTAPPPVEGPPTRAEPVAPPLAPQLVPQPPMMPPMPPPNVRRVDASEPRKITGMVLTAIGAGHGFAGTAVLAGFSFGSDGFGVLIGLLIGGPLMGEGLILTAVGIPLWVSGARTVEQVDAPGASSWVPEVDFGAGTGTATWHF